MTEEIIYPSPDGMWEIDDSPLGNADVALEDAIDSELSFLAEWLRDNAPSSREELADLDWETREQLFWRFGYLMALRSVRNFLRSRQHVLN